MHKLESIPIGDTIDLIEKTNERDNPDSMRSSCPRDMRDDTGEDTSDLMAVNIDMESFIAGNQADHITSEDAESERQLNLLDVKSDYEDEEEVKGERERDGAVMDSVNTP